MKLYFNGMNALRQMGMNLDKVQDGIKQGNLFEIIEATKFNVDPVEKGIDLRAVVTALNNDPHAKADILIKKGIEVVEAVQAKSSNSASSLANRVRGKDYHDMSRLVNSDKVVKVQELVDQRAQSGSIYSEDYKNVSQNITGELKYGNVRSGGTTHQEAMQAAQDSGKYATQFE